MASSGSRVDCAVAPQRMPALPSSHDSPRLRTDKPVSRQLPATRLASLTCWTMSRVIPPACAGPPRRTMLSLRINLNSLQPSTIIPLSIHPPDTRSTVTPFAVMSLRHSLSPTPPRPCQPTLLKTCLLCHHITTSMMIHPPLLLFPQLLSPILPHPRLSRQTLWLDCKEAVIWNEEHREDFLPTRSRNT